MRWDVGLLPVVPESVAFVAGGSVLAAADEVFPFVASIDGCRVTSVESSGPEVGLAQPARNKATTATAVPFRRLSTLGTIQAGQQIGWPAEDEDLRLPEPDLPIPDGRE